MKRSFSAVESGSIVSTVKRLRDAPSWINATDVHNYMVRDALVDWLKRYRRHRQDGRNDFGNFLFQRGRDFEREIVKHINDFRIPIRSVSETITEESCQETIRLMKQGVPIIHSAPVRYEDRRWQGVVDFLVRSDYINRLTNTICLPEESTTIPGPSISPTYHYVVVDVKFSTLALAADGIHLLNSGNYPAYKAQLWIYTSCVGQIQGYTSRYAYILGRRFAYTSKGERYNSLSCLDRLGTIDYEGRDRVFVDKTERAVEWIRSVRKYGKDWQLTPPSRPELYPNMCIDSGYWNKEKKLLAEQLGDITMIWYCGERNRQNALTHGINSWKDDRCTSATLGISGVRASVIDQILAINRQSVDNIRPTEIKTNLLGWKDEEEEMFVDFETFTDIFAPLDQLPQQDRTDRIFMIGVYYRQGRRWAYKNFLAQNTSGEEEYRIMNEFVQFVRDQGNPKLWYWHAEAMLWDKAENNQMETACQHGDIELADHLVDDWKSLRWFDLCQIFRQEPIVIRNCFKFGLKDIAQAMHQHGFITTKITGRVHSGLDAALQAWQAYHSHPDPANSDIIKDIAKYNCFDVKVLWDILRFLRQHYCR